MHYTHDISLSKKEDSNLNNYYTSDDLKESIEYLKNFNQINIFVGANNSGKSRFMRGLMISNKILWVESELIANVVKSYNQIITDFDFSLKIDDEVWSEFRNSSGKVLMKINGLNFKLDDTLILIKFDEKKSFKNHLNTIYKNHRELEKIKFIFSYVFGNHGHYILTALKSQKKDNVNYFKEREGFLDKIENVHSSIKTLLEGKKALEGKKIYIPTLRTAHSLFKEKDNEFENFKKIRDDIFLDTARKNYNELSIISHEQRKSLEDKRLQKENTNVKIGSIDVFTGMNLYNEIINVRNSKKEKREQFHEFEKFLSTYFFEGKTVDIVADFNVYRKDADIENEDLIQVFIEDKSRELYNLGDGVQALIILMYKIFLADKDSIIYIDEPEINLHPGYQRLFLEQITANPELTKKNLTYVIVTHSNHFLDLTLEKDNVSIYSFSALPKEENEEDKFMIRNVNAGDNQLLRDLGVNNSSVFLANSSIWVEGISDRNFIKAFLEAYCKAEKKKVMPREDIDFAFFEYAGSNLTHYDFRGNTSEGMEVKHLINSYALNNRVLLLSDLDEGQDTKHNTLEEIAKETKNFSYETTKPYREIENLLPNEVWGKVLIEFWNKNKISDEESIQKAQDEINASLAQTKSKTYSKKYIGEFLNALSLDGLNQIWEKGKDGSHKTFKQKAKLSEIVLREVRDGKIKWEDFAKNKTIVTLTETIYNFIKNVN